MNKGNLHPPKQKALLASALKDLVLSETSTTIHSFPFQATATRLGSMLPTWTILLNLSLNTVPCHPYMKHLALFYLQPTMPIVLAALDSHFQTFLPPINLAFPFLPFALYSSPHFLSFQ